MARIPKWAPYAFRKLNGFFCIYKPTDLSTKKVKEILQVNLARDLNALPCYKHEVQRKIHQPPSNPAIDSESTDVTTVQETSVPVTVPPDMRLSEHRLVLGPAFFPDDIKLKAIHAIPQNASGVLVMCIGRGRKLTDFLYHAKFMRVYHISGRFGMSTDDFSPRGRILERTTYYHINKSKVDKMCVLAQNNHQRHMFEYAGVFPDSQEAYEMASQGLVRPKDLNTPPMLYSVKCIDFDLPNFTLEVHSINETDVYLTQLVHDFGMQLKSSAVCTQLRRIRFGHLTLEHALVRNQWNIADIVENMQMCKRILRPNKLITRPILKQTIKETDSKLMSGGEPAFKRIEASSDISMTDNVQISEN